LSAWAELQIQSKLWEYLVDIVTPHIKTLTRLWLDTLTDFAKLQFETETADGILADDVLGDLGYSYASKEFLLEVTDSLFLCSPIDI
jgi:HEAT repeat-containing protein 5